MTTCAACKHFKPLKPTAPVVIGDTSQPDGLCRRGPPQVSTFLVPQPGGMAITTNSAWPTVQRTDGCGGFAPTVTQ